MSWLLPYCIYNGPSDVLPLAAPAMKRVWIAFDDVFVLKSAPDSVTVPDAPIVPMLVRLLPLIISVPLILRVPDFISKPLLDIVTLCVPPLEKPIESTVSRYMPVLLSSWKL